MKEKFLYLDTGYLNIEYILNAGYTFNIIVGPRGCGKTYGFSKYLLENPENFIYMRRTAVEIDISTSEEYNAFKDIAVDSGSDIHFEKAKIGKRLMVNDQLHGYALPLSTLSNLRGFNAREISYILFDEFIPELIHHRKINEAVTFFNAYETLNRNRELTGADPIKCILLSNSNNLENDFFKSLGIINIISKMTRYGLQIYEDPDASLLVINVAHSPISDAKRQTALYRLTRGRTDFDDMALNNVFVDLKKYKIKSFNLSGFKPLWRIGRLNVYRNKQGIYYGTSHESGQPKVYDFTDTGVQKFFDDHANLLVRMYINDRLFFETAEEEILFRSICEY